jgi:Uma2 family endonuclease
VRGMPKPVIVYETKPATEWLFGGPVQKLSPRFTHACMQLTLSVWLRAWAKGRGRVGTEWRVWVAPGEEGERYLVPDIMYISYERLAKEAREDAEEPHLAPDAVFEVRSKDDRKKDIFHKIDVYKRAGTPLVVYVDPYARTVTMHDCADTRVLRNGDLFQHVALPEFTFSVTELFNELE